MKRLVSMQDLSKHIIEKKILYAPNRPSQHLKIPKPVDLYSLNQLASPRAKVLKKCGLMSSLEKTKEEQNGTEKGGCDDSDSCHGFDKQIKAYAQHSFIDRYLKKRQSEIEERAERRRTATGLKIQVREKKKRACETKSGQGIVKQEQPADGIIGFTYSPVGAND